MLTRMPIHVRTSLPLKFFWDAHWDAHTHRSGHAHWGAHAHQCTCTHHGNAIPITQHCCPFPWSTQPGHLPSDPSLSPSHSPSIHLFLIPASLGWYLVSGRGGRTDAGWWGHGRGRAVGQWRWPPLPSTSLLALGPASLWRTVQFCFASLL